MNICLWQRVELVADAAAAGHRRHRRVPVPVRVVLRVNGASPAATSLPSRWHFEGFHFCAQAIVNSFTLSSIVYGDA